ncbi:hypothetical protein R3X27_25340, partial [Tropicimonas sp. TH_r6]|uniref:hypothetical protein n=1 Tax=Tropicimonas sp. TH_r6 TaxID=3082085 RepID=UPI0029557990
QFSIKKDHLRSDTLSSHSVAANVDDHRGDLTFGGSKSQRAANIPDELPVPLRCWRSFEQP